RMSPESSPTRRLPSRAMLWPMGHWASGLKSAVKLCARWLPMSATNSSPSGDSHTLAGSVNLPGSCPPSPYSWICCPEGLTFTSLPCPVLAIQKLPSLLTVMPRGKKHWHRWVLPLGVPSSEKLIRSPVLESSKWTWSPCTTSAEPSLSFSPEPFFTSQDVSSFPFGSYLCILLSTS